MSSDSSKSFPASHDSTTKLISAAIFVVLLVIAIAIPGVVVGCLAALLLAGAYAWSPRSYTILAQSIVVERLIGSVHFPLDSVREARATTADDLRGALRLFGNGGLFGYYGLFRTSKLGKCTWYVTNQRHMVVVITGAKTAVFSPDNVDGFLAAIRATAPTPLPPPCAVLPGSLQSQGARSRVGIQMGAAIGILVILLVALVFAYSPGPPSYTLTPQSLTIHDRFYPVTLQAGNVDVEHIRLVDVGVDTEWRPTARTNGFANSRYRSGWFRVASGKIVRLYEADSKRLVLLPPKADGTAVLLQASDPEEFVRKLRQEWGRS